MIACCKKAPKSCPVCFETYRPDNKIEFKNCKHDTCSECVNAHVSVHIDQCKLNITCTVCIKKMGQSDIFKCISQDLKNRYCELQMKRQMIINKNIKSCPAPDCPYAVFIQSSKDYSNCCVIDCKYDTNHPQFCIKCEMPVQQNHVCEEIKIDIGDMDVKKCPSCSILVYKNGGCNHVSCHACYTKFCWACNRKAGWAHFIYFSGCTYWNTVPLNNKLLIIFQIILYILGPVVFAVASILVYVWCIVHSVLNIKKFVLKWGNNYSDCAKTTMIVVLAFPTVVFEICGSVIAIPYIFVALTLYFYIINTVLKITEICQRYIFIDYTPVEVNHTNVTSVHTADVQSQRRTVPQPGLMETILVQARLPRSILSSFAQDV